MSNAFFERVKLRRDIVKKPKQTYNSGWLQEASSSRFTTLSAKKRKVHNSSHKL